MSNSNEIAVNSAQNYSFHLLIVRILTDCILENERGKKRRRLNIANKVHPSNRVKGIVLRIIFQFAYYRQLTHCKKTKNKIVTFCSMFNDRALWRTWKSVFHIFISTAVDCPFVRKIIWLKIEANINEL